MHQESGKTCFRFRSPVHSHACVKWPRYNVFLDDGWQTEAAIEDGGGGVQSGLECGVERSSYITCWGLLSAATERSLLCTGKRLRYLGGGFRGTAPIRGYCHY